MVQNNELIAKRFILEKAEKKHIYSGRFYCILIIMSSSCICHWEDQRMLCNVDNIILIKPGLSIDIEYTGRKHPLEILEIGFSSPLLAGLSNDETDLEYCFNIVPYSCIAIRSASQITMLIKSLAQNLITISKQSEEFASSLYKNGLMTMLVVLILRACIYTENHSQASSRKHLLLDDLFIYINTHITEEITLERLEQTFYVSKYHISREFKRQTGTTIHQYIIKMKLDLCKRLIEEGKPINEVYKLCGFGGYNHLFRAFKKEYGMTPKEYFRQVKKDIN